MFLDLVMAPSRFLNVCFGAGPLKGGPQPYIRFWVDSGGSIPESALPRRGYSSLPPNCAHPIAPAGNGGSTIDSRSRYRRERTHGGRSTGLTGVGGRCLSGPLRWSFGGPTLIGKRVGAQLELNNEWA
jgi:hypothetical protein